MCTSAAVYKDKPMYLMNFDFFEVESRIRIEDKGDIPVFFFEINQGGQFLETAGMNTKGFFGNFQGNLSDSHKNIIPDKSCITIDKLYREFLNSDKSIEELLNVIKKKKVVYPPTPPEYNKMHNMFADKMGNAIVLETSDGENDITKIKDDFLVMTNFPVGQFKNINYKKVSGIGSDRYIKAYEYISNIGANFSIDNAFDILKSTAQKEKDFETIISMVFDPNELRVYISIRRQFEKIWMVDIRRKCVETFRGFKNKQAISIAKAGVSVESLENI
ncbi:linear amide C-N hydrolase [Clostridium felsineum]|uniref:Uncharacterized protein n=1 Tax=Clostridium felsineum TaxID=36839 RepID=A0A1S8LPW0_9CLOT|nr:linear amide C-N hydrolase [Clostridium felsineum]MCR3757470.1 linear amide C-N hydrolase [Clostridium felsineum]URZ08609.1 hypothetical protein CLROS_039910 [Clostridium felsineum]URZ13640.1 hypothetical protein CROST_044060 [Clostridium felsineum]